MSGHTSYSDQGLHTETKSIDSWLLEFDHEWRVGSRERALEIAKLYIKARRDKLQPILGHLSIEQLVEQVSKLRTDKRYQDRIIVDMWLLSEHATSERHISGTAHVTVKIPQLTGDTHNGSIRDQWAVGRQPE